MTNRLTSSLPRMCINSILNFIAFQFPIFNFISVKFVYNVFIYVQVFLIVHLFRFFFFLSLPGHWLLQVTYSNSTSFVIVCSQFCKMAKRETFLMSPPIQFSRIANLKVSFIVLFFFQILTCSLFTLHVLLSMNHYGEETNVARFSQLVSSYL